MYKGSGGVPLPLYVRAGPAAETAFRFVQQGGIAAFSRTDDGLSNAMVAQVDRQRLLPLAAAVYRQLDPTTPLPATLF